jgi:hypothetical protein
MIKSSLVRHSNPKRPSVDHFKWVKGYDDLELTDTKGWADLACNVMQGWSSLDRKRIKVTDLSGLGGSKTYLIDSNIQGSIAIDTELRPHRKIILHARRKTQTADPQQDKRMLISQKVLYDHDLVTPRLHQGLTWSIEPFIDDLRGKTNWLTNFFLRLVCSPPPTSERSKFAKLLAKIHQIPTTWYEPIREALQQSYPILQSADPGSHVWIMTSRLEYWDWFSTSLSEESLKYYCDSIRVP